MSELLSTDILTGKCGLSIDKHLRWILEDMRNNSKKLFSLVNQLIEHNIIEIEEDVTELDHNVCDNINNAIKCVRQSLYYWDALSNCNDGLLVCVDKIDDYNNNWSDDCTSFPPDYAQHNFFRKLNYSECRDLNYYYSDQQFCSSSLESVNTKIINDNRCETDSWTTTHQFKVIDDTNCECDDTLQLKTIYDLDSQTESLVLSNQMLPSINYENVSLYNDKMDIINCENIETGIDLNPYTINPMISDTSNENEMSYSSNVIVCNDRIHNASEDECKNYDFVNQLNQQNNSRKEEEEGAADNSIVEVRQSLYKLDAIYQIINEKFDHSNNDLFVCVDKIDGHNDGIASTRVSPDYTQQNNAFRKLKYSEQFDDTNYYSDQELCSLETSVNNETVNVDYCQNELSEVTNQLTTTDQFNVISDGTCDERDVTNHLKTIYDLDSQTESLLLHNQMLPQLNYQNVGNDKTNTMDYENTQQNEVYLNTLINAINVTCDESELNYSNNIIVFNHNNASEVECKNYYSSKENIGSKDGTHFAKSNGLFGLRNKLKRLKTGSKTWYKCGFGACSFGSLYSGVVERHKTDKHNGCGQTEESTTIVNRFDCDWPNCGASLVTYHKLVEHMRKHTGEKPFKCKRLGCNYATGRKYSMRIHDRTHMIKVNSNVLKPYI